MALRLALKSVVRQPGFRRLTTSRRHTHELQDVYIVSSVRTPIGSFQGALAPLSATKLGALVFAEAVKRAGILPSNVEEVYFGNVISAGAGQAPARQVALGAGCPESVICTTINKVCASGMKSVMLAAQAIQLGQHIVVAGGMESMSNTPYILRGMRAGSGYGHQTAEDLILADGLTDVYNKFHMGMCAEHTAEQYNITRQAQDDYALRSYACSTAATASGRLAREILPITVPHRKGDVVVKDDEEFKNLNAAKVSTLRPAFKKEKGTVTAANASKLNDGACALVLMSGEAVKKFNVKPLARIRGFADAARLPIDFPIAPALAVPKALKAAGVAIGDVAQWEFNEAFAVVAIANQMILGLDMAKVNPYGGGVSLGHPIGMSGARITGTLAHQMLPGQIGCAAICNGGGGASAIVVEKL